MRTSRILVLLAGLLAAACDSGGGTVQELEVLSLDVQTTDPQLGHELGVFVELQAADEEEDVALLFFVANRAEVDAGAAEPTLELVDAEALARVTAGADVYDVRLDLPAGTIAPGEYYLFAVVDPLGRIPETDEANNAPAADEIRDRGVLVTIGETAQALPDLALESIEIDDPVAEVDVTPPVLTAVEGIADVPNSHFGLTATVRASGPGALPNVVLLAELEVPGVGLFPLEVWDSAAGAYAATIAIDSVVPGDPTLLHLDLHIPQAAQDVLAALLPPPVPGADPPNLLLNARVHVHLDPFDALAEYEDGLVLIGDEDGSDNRESAPLLLWFFDDDDFQSLLAGVAEPKNELRWDVPFLKEFSNDHVGIGVRFGATADVGTKGILAEAGASVPMTIVGHTIDLLALDAKGLFNPLNKADNGFAVTLKALTIKLWEKRTKEDEQLAQDPLTFAQEKAFTANFVVGPVPMFVRIGARGSVGLDVGATVGSNLQITAEPFLNFTVFAEGGPGGSVAGWTLGGGVGADMKLIDDRFHAGITAGVTYDSATSIMTGSITEEVSNDLKGPSGRVYLFVTATGKVLWKQISKRWEYVLATWKTFEKKDTLFNKTQSLSVTIGG